MISLIHANEAGLFGDHGGRFLPPQLEAPIAKVVAAYAQARQDPGFQTEYKVLLVGYVDHLSLLFLATGLTRHLDGAKICLKRESLNHTGAHEINHCLGEELLAKQMGKKKLVAEVGAGQHGVALAAVVVLLGLECETHMGAVGVAKQYPNMTRMEVLGARAVSITSSGQTLKETIDSAFSVFTTNYTDTFFAIDSTVGPDLYLSMVRGLQSTIGRGARHRVLRREDHLSDALVAAVGGGSNVLGLLVVFLEDEPMRMFGAEPVGRNLEAPDQHVVTITLGIPGTLHGIRALLLQDEDDNPTEVRSVVSGLDYSGVGPQRASLRDTGRVEYVAASDDETIAAFQLLCRIEGTIPALELPHALVHATRSALTMSPDKVIVVNPSGRGDKDVDYVVEYLAW